jgi:hypothetical protein
MQDTRNSPRRNKIWNDHIHAYNAATVHTPEKQNEPTVHTIVNLKTLEWSALLVPVFQLHYQEWNIVCVCVCVCSSQLWGVCKRAIALYLSVIKREGVTEVVINSTIRTRTRHFVTRTPLNMTHEFISKKLFSS